MKSYKEDVTKNPSGFVLLADYVPDIIQEIRYYSTYNFIGDKIDGYEEPCALLTKEAARALKAVSKELIVQGYRLKVFDAYRPACAVKHFMLWGIEDEDIRMKPYFYPGLRKQELFEKGYVAKQSSHSRGSTVDLTLVDMNTGKEVDMGSPFDLFGEKSHPDYRGITDEQYENRMILQKAMLRNGFLPLDCEWWHFTLDNEPYPDTYFEFPVSSEYLRK
ncbi:MAG: M15 family metallopeptidase [Ruminococcus sp.]|jgi:D-alanyl-D-alanine dipeptidase|nr:M15 family metallopeptidase [Ruminococcus sp.]